MAKPRPPLESKIESDFLKELKKRGYPVKTRKMNGLGNRSWPDRLVIGPEKFTMWIEFKRPELGQPSEGQKDLFSELGELNHTVEVHTDAMRAADAVGLRLFDHGVIL